MAHRMRFKRTAQANIAKKMRNKKNAKKMVAGNETRGTS
jgi:hypothetical protein